MVFHVVCPGGQFLALRLISSRSTLLPSCTASAALRALSAWALASASCASSWACWARLSARPFSLFAMACLARSSLSRAVRMSPGAASWAPAFMAWVTAALATAICAVGGGVLAQAPTSHAVAANASHKPPLLVMQRGPQGERWLFCLFIVCPVFPCIDKGTQCRDCKQSLPRSVRWHTEHQQPQIRSAQTPGENMNATTSKLRSFQLFVRKVATLALPYFRSEEKWKARALLAAIVVLKLGAVYMLVLINDWNRVFYDALQNKDAKVFWHELGRFTYLAFGFIVIAVYRFYLTQLLQMRWRARPSITWSSRAFPSSMAPSPTTPTSASQKTSTSSPATR